MVEEQGLSLILANPSGGFFVERDPCEEESEEEQGQAEEGQVQEGGCSSCLVIMVIILGSFYVKFIILQPGCRYDSYLRLVRCSVSMWAARVSGP